MLVGLVVSVYALLVVCLIRAIMRIVPKRVVKSLFVGSFLCFVVINMNLFLHTGDGQLGQADVVVPILDGGPEQGGPRPIPANQSAPWWHAGTANATNGSRHAPQPPIQNRIQKPAPAPGYGPPAPLKFANATQGGGSAAYVPIGVENLTRIQEFIGEANRRQQILNLDKFDLLASDNAIVIVVQVHNRIDYLKYLIDSLAKAKDIYQTLLIFSHDWFDDSMNQLVRSIDFCPVSTDRIFGAG